MKNLADPALGALIVRRHVADGIASEAVFSPCGTYRYSLTRVWDAAAPRLAFLMLNPSTADERANDPTVVRCVRRARGGGWGAVRVCNLFALRETSPARLKAHPEPEGPDNPAAIEEVCRWADAVVAAWGVHGAWRGQAAEVAARLRRLAPALLCLGVTLAGHPRHPLHLSYATPLVPWDGTDVTGHGAPSTRTSAAFGLPAIECLPKGPNAADDRPDPRAPFLSLRCLASQSRTQS